MKTILSFLSAGVLALSQLHAAAKPDVIVAPDGTGQYKSLQEAISAAPMKTDPAMPRWVIFVKAGTYHERIYVQRERGNIRVIGEDVEKTVIAYNMHARPARPRRQAHRHLPHAHRAGGRRRHDPGKTSPSPTPSVNRARRLTASRSARRWHSAPTATGSSSGTAASSAGRTPSS